MNEKQITRTSRLLSLVLRHEPEKIGLTLDDSGWAIVDELLVKFAAFNKPLTFDQLRIIVATNNKQRFAFSEDQTRIRANQGHSININLGLTPSEQQPPASSNPFERKVSSKVIANMFICPKTKTPQQKSECVMAKSSS